MDELETTTPPADTNTGADLAPSDAPDVAPEVGETDEVPADVQTAPVADEVAIAPVADVTTDVAPEEIPQVHNDDGSVGRELDHVVNQ